MHMFVLALSYMSVFLHH